MTSRVLAAAIAAVLIAAGAARADVRLVRGVDGRARIFNDVGSGWTVRGRAPSDDYLVSRRNSPSAFDDAIGRHAGANGVDARLVKCVMLVESNFNPRALSRKGARGLMQLMPQTARRFGVENSFDAEENIRGGVRYLSELLQMFGGDVPLALAAYNAGEGAVQKYGGVPPYAETQEYVRRTMIAYGDAGPVQLLSGGFRGVAPGEAPRIAGAGKPAPAAVSASAPSRRPAGPPVRLRERGGQVHLSNDSSSSTRPAPLLGRVALAPASPGR